MKMEDVLIFLQI